MKSKKQGRHILFVTTTRADWSLLRLVVQSLIDRRSQAEGLSISVLASSTHLVEPFGSAIGEVLDDVDCKVYEVKLGDARAFRSVNERSTGRIAAKALEVFFREFQRLRPNIAVILGDRFEILACAIAAAIAKVPIAHIEGGHITLGAIDDRYRHAITKLANLHYAALPIHGERIIAMVENAGRVVITGPLGVQNMRQAQQMSAEQICNVSGFSPNERSIFIVTVHPETLSNLSPKDCIGTVLKAVERCISPEIGTLPPAFVFTAANIDAGGKFINAQVKLFCSNHPTDARFVTSFGHMYYGSVLKAACGIVGNSSSGILEAAAIGIPVINIGNRQMGRDRYGAATDVGWDADEISRAILDAALSVNAGRAQQFAEEGRRPSDIIADDLIGRELSSLYRKDFPFAERGL
jgi:UDP-hydrolysing UDP-N-acetyl-D-glucosamine 2-epimerase